MWFIYVIMVYNVNIMVYATGLKPRAEQLQLALEKGVLASQVNKPHVDPLPEAPLTYNRYCVLPV